MIRYLLVLLMALAVGRVAHAQSFSLNPVTSADNPLSFSSNAGVATPPQFVTLTNNTNNNLQVSLSASTTSGGNWLSASISPNPVPGKKTGTITVSINSLTLQAMNNPYTGTITVSAGGTTLTIYVSLQISGVSISANSSVSVSVPQGQKAQGSVNITGGGATVQVSANANFLIPPASTVNAPGSFNFTVDATSLNGGSYSGNLTLQCVNGSPCVPVVVSVSVTVVAPFSIRISPDPPPAVMLAQGQKQVIPFSIIAAANSSGEVTIASSASWLEPASTDLMAPGQVNVTVDSTGLAAANYAGALTFSCVNSGCPAVSVIVNLTVSPGAGGAVSQLFPHIADGNEWQTDFLLINPTSNTITVNMVFHLDGGVTTLPIIGLGPVTGISNISLPPLGSALYSTAGFSSGPIVSGWVEVDSPVSINGQALFRRHASDGRYYEGSVPLTTPSQSFTIPFDGSTYPGGTAAPIATFYTGIALANPNVGTSATVNCSAYDPTGASLGNFQAATLAGMTHTAAVLQTTAPYMSVVGTNRGILVCNASAAIGIIGLRFFGLDALSSLPVASVGASLSAPTQLFPHIADGNEWQTDFLLINPTSSTITVNMVFHLDNGVTTLPIIGVGAVSGISNITLPPLGSALYRTEGFSSGPIVSGWVEVDAPVAIAGQALFRRYASDGGYYEGSVPLATPAENFTMPFDGQNYPGGTAPTIATLYTGVALADPNAGEGATVSCTAYDPNGESLGSFQAATLTDLSHTAAVLQTTGTYENVIGTNRGILICNSTASIGVLGLRFFGLDALSSLPVTTNN